MKIYSVVLAAGHGKRMKSKLYKVLHPVCGKPMVGHVVDVLESIQADRIVVIVGHGAEAVREYLGDRVEYAMQEKQLGTCHAVLQAKHLLQDAEGITIIICGDTPLVSEESLKKMIKQHQEQQVSATILTAKLSDPTGYGRIIRDSQGLVVGIREQKDCTEAESAISEVNAGTYLFDNRSLFASLEQVKNTNVQQEYYLTDVIGILREQGKTVMGYCTEDVGEAIGVNDRVALAEAEQLLRERIIHQHLLKGVTITDPRQTYIEKDVTIGSDTLLLPGCILKGSTRVGEDCIIGPFTEIVNSELGNGVQVKQSVLHHAIVGDESTIGPFAYLRPGAKLGRQVKIGDFVEIKNSTLGDGSKVSHLSYVGDAMIGKNVNFGCGSITVNYDGFNKQITQVEDDAFIGSNVNLVAPVKVGKGAYVVAGSTITQEVMDNDMAIARQRQTNKTGYAQILRARFKDKK